jgi:hypothetical protein
MFVDVAIETKGRSKDMVEKVDVVFIKLLTKRIQGILNEYPGEEHDDVIQVDLESV